MKVDDPAGPLQPGKGTPAPRREPPGLRLCYPSLGPQAPASDDATALTTAHTSEHPLRCRDTMNHVHTSCTPGQPCVYCSAPVLQAVRGGACSPGVPRQVTQVSGWFCLCSISCPSVAPAPRPPPAPTNDPVALSPEPDGWG